MSSTTARHLGGSSNSGGSSADDVRDDVEDTIDEHPSLLLLARTGWVAKGIVYALMGLTAISIGRRQPTDDDASPGGSLGAVADARWGTPLLGLLVAGLVVYVCWRLVTAALMRGTSTRDWLTRAGHVASAASYSVLAVSTVRALLAGGQPRDSNSIERVSSAMLETIWGRWMLLAVGAVIVGIGAVFVVETGVRRSFCDDLHLENASERERQVVTVTGVVGWIGRGLGTAAVGAFVIGAAWTTDPDDARGLDQALRELATMTYGGVAVIASGVALIGYALFCWTSLRHRKLEG